MADSSSAIFFLTWLVINKLDRPIAVGVSVFLGYALWTLTEYIFHRWVYHQVSSIFSDGHRIHHQDAKVLIAMPWVVTTASVFALWYFVARSNVFPYFSGGLAGWLGGFVFYSLVHHSHHHWNITNAWFRKLKAYHKIHHQFPETNFGVTMRSWDYVFNTIYRKSKTTTFLKQNDIELEYERESDPYHGKREPELVLKP